MAYHPIFFKKEQDLSFCCYIQCGDLKSSLVYPNGLTASWTYGNRGELLEVNNASPTGTISRYTYTYDAAGRRVACGKSGTAFEQSDSVNYGYNARSELTSATAAVDSDYRYGYNFDDIGNRKSSAERGTNSVYTASQLNQYTAVDDFTPTYDADGNETLVKTATGIWQVTYNGENRPVRWELVSSNSNTPNSNTQTLLRMSFDRMGRRVTKNDQRFVYDGYLQIANYHSPTPTLNSNFFIWDPTEPVATRPLAWTTSTTNHESPITNFYTHDGNKNVSDVIASDTDVAAHYEYAPFGALTVSRGEDAAANPWRFSSEYAEDDTATVYYNYRHYEPVTGRWMQRDIGEEDLSMNLYGFIDNGQVNVIDEIGLVKFSHPESCPNCTGKNLDDLIQRLKHFLVKYAKEKGEISKKVEVAWGKKAGWDNVSAVRDKIDMLIRKLKGDGITIECCYNGKACEESGGIKPDAFSPRPEGSGPKNPKDELDFNTIYLCDQNTIMEHGGCACAIVHELLHKLGLTTDEKDKEGGHKKDTAVTEISAILTGLGCKAYGVQ